MLYIENRGSLVLLRNEIPSGTLEFITGALTFSNQEYFVRKAASGRRPRGISPRIKAFWDTSKTVTLPRAFLPNLKNHFDEEGIEFELKDFRVTFDSVAFNDNIELRAEQTTAVEALIAAGPSILAAPPGAGKTVMGLKIIALLGQPALILVHRKQLMEQWIERAQTFLGLDKKEIGRIGGGRDRVGKKLTIGMLQSVSDRTRLARIGKAFGLIIVDECHHIPARTFLKTVKGLEAGLIFGLTATPFRKYRDEKLIFLNIGPVSATMAHSGAAGVPVDVTTVETGFFSSRNPKKDGFEPLARDVIANSFRNRLIAGTIISETSAGRKVMVITERVEHVETIFNLLGPAVSVVAVSGTSEREAKTVAMERIKARDYDAIVTTGQFMGEGTDLPDLDTLVLAFPFSFEGKLIQNLGRIQRSGGEKKIFDFRDRGCSYLEILYRKRRRFYKKLVEAGGSLTETPVPPGPYPQSEIKVGRPSCPSNFGSHSSR